MTARHTFPLGASNPLPPFRECALDRRDRAFRERILHVWPCGRALGANTLLPLWVCDRALFADTQAAITGINVTVDGGFTIKGIANMAPGSDPALASTMTSA